MEICGTPIKKSFSKPYKSSKDSDWKITISINGSKTNQTKEFKIRAEADNYVEEFNNKWFLSVTDGNGNHLRDETFDTKKLAMEYVRDSKNNQKEKIKSTKELIIDSETTFLEDMAKDGKFPALVNDVDDDDMSHEIEEKLAAHKTDFDTDLDRAEDDAKSLLMSVAQLYLDTKLIDDNNYIQFKMTIEKKGLSSLIFQLDIARKALYKLSEQIHNGKHSAKNYEVLSQLQRIVLDVTKYQHEYLDDIEESMKRLAEDHETGRMKPKGGITVETVEDDEGSEEVSVISTSNRVRLLTDINKIVDESKKAKTPQSVNKNLHIEDDDSMTDAIEIKTGDEDEGGDVDEDISELGLQSL